MLVAATSPTSSRSRWTASALGHRVSPSTRVPDERHIRYQDVRDLKRVVTTEFNIEGNPIPSFMDLVEEVRPHQVTLVPDAPDALTSNAGWDIARHRDFLTEILGQLHAWGIRTSIFVGTDLKNLDAAAALGTDRVELYTEPYASDYPADRTKAVAPFVQAAEHARSLGLALNAGHDLSLENLRFFSESIPFLSEVSIGHALISDASTSVSRRPSVATALVSQVSSVSQ